MLSTSCFPSSTISILSKTSFFIIYVIQWLLRWGARSGTGSSARSAASPATGNCGGLWVGRQSRMGAAAWDSGARDRDDVVGARTAARGTGMAAWGTGRAEQESGQGRMGGDNGVWDCFGFHVAPSYAPCLLCLMMNLRCVSSTKKWATAGRIEHKFCTRVKNNIIYC